MKLGKPPVVEVSVDFVFESSAGEPEWDFQRASQFVYQFQGDYPETEVASTPQLIQVQKFSRGTTPTFTPTRVPIAVRAFPANRSRFVLNSKDLLRCILVRTDENDYEGFSALKNEAIAKLAAYVEFFRPAKLIAFNLRYVDFFRIPIKENGKAELRDFFTMCGEPDEAIFGTTVAFRKAFTTRPPNSDDLLTCELYNVPKGRDTATPGVPFRMEWGLHAFKDITWDAAVLGPRLQKAHDSLLHCFEKSFTAAGWELFEPNAGRGEP